MKVLCAVLILCIVTAMFYSVRKQSALHEQFLYKDVSGTTDLVSSEAFSEEEEEEVEEEVVPYWDIFKHSDVPLDKDVFFIESSGLV